MSEAVARSLRPLSAGDLWDGRRVEEIAAGWKTPLELYRSVPSTNGRALTWARGGGPPWLTVIADEQTAGRGRRGRHWESRRGLGLWMSVVVPLATERASALPLHAGLVAAQAAEGVSGSSRQGRIGLKWPNDLYIGGRKVGGVLCEVATTESVVVGIGLNTRHASSDFGTDLEDRAISLEQAWGEPVVRLNLAKRIVKGLRAVPELDRLDDVRLAELRRRDVLGGSRVSVSTGGSGPGDAGSQWRGVAQRIDSDGALIVLGDDGRTARVTSGTVERFEGE